MLEGVRVLELGSRVTAPYCGKLLADFGADVIKVEPPDVGDQARRAGPFVGDDPHPEKSIPFLFLNTNKRGITLNPAPVTGRDLLTALIQRVDVLVHNLPPTEAESLGLSYQDLAELNPGLVVTSITPFGRTGPYRDFVAEDIVTCALSGLMYHSGDSDREPLHNALDQSFYVAGANAAGATLAAFFGRLSSGLGQQVDVSVAECLAAHLVQAVPYYTYMGAIKGRRATRGSGFEELMPARDGYVVPSAQGSQPFSVVAEVIGMEELRDQRFSTVSGRVEYGEDLKQLLLEGLANWDRKPLFQASGERRLVFGMAQDASDLYDCPQLAAREFFVEVDHPAAGKAKYAGMGPKLSEKDFQVRRPAPLLGQHNVEIYCRELGRSSQEMAGLRAAGVI
jgi:crotonobetainyl-CoA:carnitine CoA-transferase CaiB-like acyl-CoA transferase